MRLVDDADTAMRSVARLRPDRDIDILPERDQ
jgi:hypothetical protein